MTQPARPQILGHRGIPRRENTLGGLQACLDAGLDGAEIDVQLLADGTVAVFHDLDLRRLAGDPRAIAQLRVDELAGVRVFGEPIPTLAELLERWPDDRWLNIELKAGGRALVTAVLGQIEARERVVISSFDPELLAAAQELTVSQDLRARAKRGCRAAGPSLETTKNCRHELALLLAPESPSWLHVDGGRSFGCRGVHLHASLVAPATIARYGGLGLEVGFWGARDPAHERQLAALGVTRVITDFIGAS